MALLAGAEEPLTRLPRAKRLERRALGGESAAAIGALSLLCGCLPDGPPTEEPMVVEAEEADAPLVRFSDRFDRTAVGPDWRATGDGFRIQDGALCVSEARNHGLWLAHRLPQRVRIEFDAWARSPEGDIKVELFGDGRSFARDDRYDHATGYVAVFGGWDNSRHVLARLDEHGKDRLEVLLSQGAEDPRALPVVPDRAYHFVFERRSIDRLTWTVNGVALLEYRDPTPLLGEAHAYFGFNDWTAPVCFDNLEILAF
jgi:hypothetical protein